MFSKSNSSSPVHSALQSRAVQARLVRCLRLSGLGGRSRLVGGHAARAGHHRHRRGAGGAGAA